jgi:hypothetical protein
VKKSSKCDKIFGDEQKLYNNLFSTPLRSVENAAVERELLPSAPLRENQEFETDAPPGHRSTAALAA